MRIDAPVFVPTTSTTAANSSRSVRRRFGCEMPRQTISVLNPDAEPFVPSGRCWLAPPTGYHAPPEDDWRAPLRPPMSPKRPRQIKTTRDGAYFMEEEIEGVRYEPLNSDEDEAAPGVQPAKFYRDAPKVERHFGEHNNKTSNHNNTPDKQPLANKLGSRSKSPLNWRNNSPHKSLWRNESLGKSDWRNDTLSRPDFRGDRNFRHSSGNRLGTGGRGHPGTYIPRQHNPGIRHQTVDAARNWRNRPTSGAQGRGRRLYPGNRRQNLHGDGSPRDVDSRSQLARKSADEEVDEAPALEETCLMGPTVFRNPVVVDTWKEFRKRRELQNQKPQQPSETPDTTDSSGQPFLQVVFHPNVSAPLPRPFKSKRPSISSQSSSKRISNGNFRKSTDSILPPIASFPPTARHQSPLPTVGGFGLIGGILSAGSIVNPGTVTAGIAGNSILRPSKTDTGPAWRHLHQDVITGQAMLSGLHDSSVPGGIATGLPLPVSVSRARLSSGFACRMVSVENGHPPVYRSLGAMMALQQQGLPIQSKGVLGQAPSNTVEFANRYPIEEETTHLDIVRHAPSIFHPTTEPPNLNLDKPTVPVRGVTSQTVASVASANHNASHGSTLFSFNYNNPPASFIQSGLAPFGGRLSYAASIGSRGPSPLSMHTVSSRVTDRISEATDRAFGATDRISGVTDRISAAADRTFGATDQISGAADRISGAADRISGAADRISGATDRTFGATDRISGAPDRISGATDRTFGATDRISGAADRISGETDGTFGATDRISGETDRSFGATDRSFGATDRISGAADRISGADRIAVRGIKNSQESEQPDPCPLNAATAFGLTASENIQPPVVVVSGSVASSSEPVVVLKSQENIENHNTLREDEESAADVISKLPAASVVRKSKFAKLATLCASIQNEERTTSPFELHPKRKSAIKLTPQSVPDELAADNSRISFAKLVDQGVKIKDDVAPEHDDVALKDDDVAPEGDDGAAEDRCVEVVEDGPTIGSMSSRSSEIEDVLNGEKPIAVEEAAVVSAVDNENLVATPAFGLPDFDMVAVTTKLKSRLTVAVKLASTPGSSESVLPILAALDDEVDALMSTKRTIEADDFARIEETEKSEIPSLLGESDGKWPSPLKSVGSGRLIWRIESLLSVRSYPSCTKWPEIPLMNDVMTQPGSLPKTAVYGRSGNSVHHHHHHHQHNLLRTKTINSYSTNDNYWDPRKSPVDVVSLFKTRSEKAGGSRKNCLANEESTKWRKQPQAKIPLPELDDDSWLVLQKKEKDEGDRLKTTCRRLRGLLNRMTDDKFEAIYLDMLALIDQEDEVKELMNLVFEKATTQHAYVKLYADLTARLDKDLKLKGIFKGKEEGSSSTTGDFMPMILEVCQRTFEANLASKFEAPAGITEEYEYELLYKYKLRMKGNLKLVGELLMRGIMTPKVGLHIMSELLESRDKDKLEALASFMTTVGEFFETSSHVTTRMNQIYHTYVEKVGNLIAREDIPVRIQCLFKDLIEGTGNLTDAKSDADTTTKIRDMTTKNPDVSVQGKELWPAEE